jgi:hypothetical protein
VVGIVPLQQTEFDYRSDLKESSKLWDEAALVNGPFPDPSVVEVNFEEVVAHVTRLLEQGHMRYFRGKFDQALRLYSQSASFLEQYTDNHPVDGHAEDQRLWLREYSFVRHPMLLGDAYFQVGSYLMSAQAYARTGGFTGVTAPLNWGTIWTRAAEAVAEAGEVFFRKGLTKEADDTYEMLFDSKSFLFYGKLQGVWPHVQEILKRMDTRTTPLDATFVVGYTPLLEATVARAYGRQLQLRNGEDFFGYTDGQIPLIRYDRLRELAKSFAQAAVRATREYISFKTSVEEQTYTNENVRRAVSVEEEGVAVEIAAFGAASAETRAAQEALVSVETRRRLASEARRDYSDVGWDIADLEELSAWASSAQGSTNTRLGINGFEHLGLQGGYVRADHRIQEIAGLRARKSYGLRVRELERQVAALDAEIASAEAQVQAASARTKVAMARVQAARARHAAAAATYQEILDREMNPRIYFELALEARKNAHIYLDRAVHVAHLMERAYEAEQGLEVNRIRGDYGDLNGGGGLYAADMLARDIDFFDFHRAVTAKDKQQQAVRCISLRSEFPLEFLRLIKFGETEFGMTLEDLQSRHPGIYNARVKKVIVECVGYYKVQLPPGSLTSGSSSSYRLYDPVGGGFLYRTRKHGSETLVLSDFRLAKDSFILPADSDEVSVFENIGLDVSWHLRFPLRLNDFSGIFLEDVQILIAYMCQHDALLEVNDVEAQSQVGEVVLPFILSEIAGEQFILDLNAKRTASFDLSRSFIDPKYREPKIRKIELYLDSPAPPDRIVVGLGGESTGELKVDPNGSVRLQDGNGVALFAGTSPTETWEIALISENEVSIAEVVVVVEIEYSVNTGT